MCRVIAIQILDAVLFSSGNQNLPQSDQALRAMHELQTNHVPAMNTGVACFKLSSNPLIYMYGMKRGEGGGG